MIPVKKNPFEMVLRIPIVRCERQVKVGRGDGCLEAALI